MTVWLLWWANKSTEVLGGVIAVFADQETAAKAQVIMEAQEHPTRKYVVAEYAVYSGRP